MQNLSTEIGCNGLGATEVRLELERTRFAVLQKGDLRRGIRARNHSEVTLESPRGHLAVTWFSGSPLGNGDH